MALRSCVKLKKMSKESMQELITFLSEFSISSNEVRTSFIGGSRYLHNPNNRLNQFLDSLINHTSDLSKIEVLARIDEDDDLLFYKRIKIKYGSKIRMRFVVGSANNGYEKLFSLVSELINYLSPSSKIVAGFADDCLIVKRNWDVFFEGIANTYQDNIFFINTTRNFSLPYNENESTFFWLLWSHGPPSLFTAVGREVLNLTAQVASQHKDWTPYGNTLLCDSFFETLQYYIWQSTHLKREPVFADMVYLQPDLLIPKHKEGALTSASPVAIRSNTKFLKDETQVVIKEMATRILNNIEPQGCDLDNRTLLKYNTSDGNKSAKIVILIESLEINADELKLLLESITEHSASLDNLSIIIRCQYDYILDICLAYKSRLSMTIIYEQQSDVRSLSSIFNPTVKSCLSNQFEFLLLVNNSCQFVLKNWDTILLSNTERYRDHDVIDLAAPADIDSGNYQLHMWNLWRLGALKSFLAMSRSSYYKYCDILDRLSSEKYSILKESISWHLVLQSMLIRGGGRSSENPIKYVDGQSHAPHKQVSYNNYLLFLKESTQDQLARLYQLTLAENQNHSQDRFTAVI
jgi:hypothetical protein